MLPCSDVWKSEDCQMCSRDRDLVGEVYDYLGQGPDPSWSLGRPHLTCLVTLAKGSGSLSPAACQLISAVMLHADMCMLALGGSPTLLDDLNSKFDDFTEDIKINCLKIVIHLLVAHLIFEMIC